MRGIATAIYMFIFNGTGLSLGLILFAVLTGNVGGVSHTVALARYRRSLHCAGDASFPFGRAEAIRICVAVDRSGTRLMPAIGGHP